MSLAPVLSLAEFLAAPVEQVAEVAPATLLFAPGGTRRGAVLQGVAPTSDAYARWSRERVFACVDLFFRMGVRHVFVTILRYRQLAEVGRYRERLTAWIDWGLAGPEALADYARCGWRARLTGVEQAPELHPVAERLVQVTPPTARHTVWWYVCPTPDDHWTTLLEAARRAAAPTQAATIAALYGEPIPPATLLLGFGKPTVSADIVPLLLAGDLQCYWAQRPSYDLDEPLLRHILYDYAYLRRTWTNDKSERYHDVQAQRELWETAPALGLGQRIGPFWHPLT